MMQKGVSNIDEVLRALRSSCIDPSCKASVLLRQTRVLAFELKQSDLDVWARRELEGYDGVDADDLPKYRHIPMVPKGHFIGGFGRELKNAPVHLEAFPASARKQLYESLTVHCARGPISEYEVLADATQGTMQIDLSRLINIIGDNVYEGMSCIGLQGISSTAKLAAISEGVKNRILSLTIELATRFPAGELDYLLKHPAPVSNVINTVINGGQANVAVSSEQFSQTLNVSNQAGDIESLRRTLEDEGAPEAVVGELVEAVQLEQPISGALGPRVSSIVGKLTSLAADGSWKISIAVAAKLLADSIKNYYELK
jgi:hypothetical protein